MSTPAKYPVRVKNIDGAEIILGTSNKLIAFAQVQFSINEDWESLSEPTTEAEALRYIDEYCGYLKILKDEAPNEEGGITLELTEEDLPSEVGEELENAIAEAISNKTGFCHTGFTFTIVVNSTLDHS